MDAIYIFSKSKNGETKPPWADFKVVTEGPGEDCTYLAYRNYSKWREKIA